MFEVGGHAPRLLAGLRPLFEAAPITVGSPKAAAFLIARTVSLPASQFAAEMVR